MTMERQSHINSGIAGFSFSDIRNYVHQKIFKAIRKWIGDIKNWISDVNKSWGAINDLIFISLIQLLI